MKQVQEIYRDMQETFANRAGFSMADSSDLAVRLYAAAAEIETLYTYSAWALRQSFPQTASGEYLDMHAALRALARRQAVRASGVIRFSLPAAAEQPVTVPAGTVCLTPGLVQFRTTEDAVIAAGALSCDAAACAEETGEAGNVAAGTVTVMQSPPIGVSACENPFPFTGGCAEETDDALRKRVLESFVRLPNGANSAFYEARVRAVSGVSGVQVLPRARGVGTVDVVVAASGDVSQTALLQTVAADLEQVREIAVDVRVLPPTENPVSLAVTVWAEDGVAFSDAQAAAEQAIASCFTGALLGKPLYLAAVGQKLLETGLIKNYCITAPAADVTGADGVLPVLGTLTVTEGA